MTEQPDPSHKLYFENKPDQPVSKKRWPIIVLIIFLFLLLILGGAVAGFKIKYEKRIFPGVKIGNINLGGMTPAEALRLINQVTDNIENDGLKFAYPNNGKIDARIMPIINAVNDPDLSRNLLTFHNQETINTAWRFGRDHSLVQNFFDRMTAVIFDKKINAQFDLDEIGLNTLLKQEFSDIEQPPQDAKPQITPIAENYQIVMTAEKSGILINYVEAINIAKDQLSRLNNEAIIIKMQTRPATITQQEATVNENLVLAAISSTTPELIYDDKHWSINRSTFLKMIEFQKVDNQISVGLNYDQFKNWLKTYITPTINIEPEDAKMEIVNGKITSLTAERAGLKVAEDKTYWRVSQNLKNNIFTTAIITEIVEPQTFIGDVNNLGIKEIIGVGKSNFAGSPTNRRHNIQVGANKLHGILIKPEEEFSLINTLGVIDQTSGYLPELVIKENKTIPEYGGGLCQIGTTLFRVALDSGLPILERQAHAYSVTYYLENGLPGVDATIYSPKPDVRIKNDTGNYILIQTFIKGNDLRFEFWGTKDGRQVEKTKPKVWGWVDPEPTKYIETLDIPVGTKKCTESAHKGVNASFDYTVTYSSGEIKKTNFYSKYKPWQAVCLIGVASLPNSTTTAPTITTATTTASIQ